MIGIYKKKGETPLHALERFRVQQPSYKNEKLSYAGRLDPMAEGVMLVLVGEENKEREKYLGLDKTYVTEILFGVGTDTGDVLGIVKNPDAQSGRGADLSSVGFEKELKKSVGKFSQKYPAYSSKNFAGDYESVHAGKKLETSHDVEVYSAEFLEMREISSENLLQQIKNDISPVVGDFRQEEIIKTWEDNLKGTSHAFPIAKIRLSVSSGFYVRQFAEDLGEILGLPALALSILREKVDEYELKDCVL